MLKFVRKHILPQLFIPLVFVLYISGISMFPHTHIINGNIIVHSHIYLGDHEHTAAEAETIAQLSTCYFQENITHIDIPENISVLLYSFAVPSTIDGKYSEHLLSETLRGPPFLFNA